MKISTLIISVVIFNALFTGMLQFYTSTAVVYGSNYENPAMYNAYMETMSDTSSFYRLTTDIEENIKNSGGKGLLANFATAGLFVIDSLVLFIQMPGQLMHLMAHIMGLGQAVDVMVPAWFYAMISAVIYVAIIFAVLSYIRGGKT